jgi:5,6-dimethylbenzimidazole synthase
MENQTPAQQDIHFTDADRTGLYKTIFNRRDVRGQFKPTPVPDEILSRILVAAHHAPSVGFMQPWDFLVIRDQTVKQAVHAGFLSAHTKAAKMFEGKKRKVYKNLKLEGILESPINICITCDRDRTGPVVIGRTADPAMDLYSSVCAVQNFWLAARAEGIGVGWVSIIKRKRLQKVLGMPKLIVPIAYLCVGYVDHFYKKPELESAGWLPRLAVDEQLHFEQWGKKDGNGSETLKACVREDSRRTGSKEFVIS